VVGSPVQGRHVLIAEIEQESGKRGTCWPQAGVALPAMSRSGARRFTSGRAFRPHRLARRSGTRSRGTTRGGASGLARERAPRHGAARFALQNPRYRARDARPAMGFALVLACGIGICGAPARARLGLTFPWRAKSNACAGAPDRCAL